MIIGQDESVFHQYSLVTKQWVGADGQRALLPKLEGAGIMISAFQACEIGIPQEIEKNMLEKINRNRLQKNYVTIEAANELNRNSMKPPLLSSPFLAYFEYGANNDGYWGYNNMVLQFEDVVDVVKVLYPNFEFVFLFDHSSGHKKKC